MAQQDINSPVSASTNVVDTFVQTLRGAYDGFIDWLTAIAEESPRMATLKKISEMSDEELAAQGHTRVSAVQQAIGTYL